MKENAEAVKEPSLADMAKLLSVPLETLERTREASPAGSSSPEYWEKWYNDTLENSVGAKRANRDFESSVSSCVAVSRKATEAIYEDFNVSLQQDIKAKEGTADGSVKEEVVCANIVLPLDYEGRGTSKGEVQET